MRLATLAVVFALVTLPAHAEQWCLVQDGALVDGPRDLPSEWKAEQRIQYTEPAKVDPSSGEIIAPEKPVDYTDTVTFTGLSLWPEAELNARGWQRVQDDLPAFDPDQFMAERAAFEFKAGECVQHYTVVALPEPEKSELDLLIDALIAKGVITEEDVKPK